MPGTTIPRNPATWTLEDARAALQTVSRVTYSNQGVSTSARMAVDAYAKMSAGYMAGDHRQDLVPYNGAGFDSAGNLSDRARQNINRLFASAPEVESIVARRVNGACGNQADFSAVPVEPEGEEEAPDPTDAEKAAQKRIAHAWKRQLSAWSDTEKWWSGGRAKNSELGAVQRMVARGTAHQNGAACLRVFIDPEALVNGEIPKQPNRRAALELIHLVSPSPDTCCVYSDPDTKRDTGIFTYEDKEGRQAAEIWFKRKGRPVDRLDLSKGLTDTRTWHTWLRVLTEGKAEGDARTERVFTYPWGGLLPIVQVEVGCLITPSILSMQAGVDSNLTALNRLLMAHGWAQRDELNARPASRLSLMMPPPDIYGPPETELIEGVTWYVWPEERALGGVVNNINGFPYRTGIDENGKETWGFTTPVVNYHEPSSPEALIQGIDYFISRMRDGCAQGHVPVGGGSTAEASGEAYEQRRADHKADITGVAEAVDVGVAQMLTMTTVIADWMQDEAKATAFTSRHRIVAQSHPNAGPVSADAQRVTMELGKERVLAMATVRARVGVQDVQAEEDAVQAQPLTLKEQVETANLLRGEGADAVASYVKVGMDEETARALARTDGGPFLEQ